MTDWKGQAAKMAEKDAMAAVAARTADHAASAQFHAGMVAGALAMQGVDFEFPTLEWPGVGDTRAVLLGTTRGGNAIEITIEVRDAL